MPHTALATPHASPRGADLAVSLYEAQLRLTSLDSDDDFLSCTRRTSPDALTEDGGVILEQLAGGPTSANVALAYVSGRGRL